MSSKQTDFIEEQISDRYRALDFAHAVATVPESLPISDDVGPWREPETDEVSGYPALAETMIGDPRREGQDPPPWDDHERARLVRDLGVATIVRWSYNIAIAMLIGAVVVATWGGKSLLAFSLGLLGLSICSFGNYTAARLGQIAWMPAAIASRLTIGFLFLALTALLAAQVY